MWLLDCHFPLYRAMAIATILLTASLPLVLGIFNADELKLMNYEVDILSIPIKANEDLDLPVIHMTSKYGQQYQCLLPHSIRLAEEAASSSKDPDEATVPEIQDLLKPLRTGPCLIKPKDWWTYEFCVGRHIRQYHIEGMNSQIAGPVVSLGVYDSDYDWSSEIDQDDYAKLKQTRFHSQFYVNGSSCDLTGTPRTTEVRFFCEVDAGDYISRVDEPETCRYILSVHTHRVCSHPYLKPASSTKPHTIQCNPVLEEKHYAKYLQRTQEEQQKAERKRQEWIADQQKQLEELKLRIQQQKEKHKNKEAAKETEEVNVESLDGEEEEDGDPDLAEYEEVVSSLSEKERLKILEDRIKLQEAITQEFDSIIEEAEVELQQEMEEGARQTAYSKLASTLSQLISKLDKAEKDVAQATARFKKVQGQIGKLQALTEEGITDTSASGINGQDIKNVAEVNEKTAEEDDEDDESKLMPDFDNKVRVRIRKVEHDSLNRLEDGKNWFHQKELDQGQKTKLEEAVKDKLQKAGLDASGRRIEVKIITAGYYNDDDDGKNYHILSDEDTAQFQNMILTLLTGSQEARREVERQRQLEKNYQFVWGEDQPTTEDSEES